MQIESDLKGLFSYSLLPIFIVLIIIVILIILICMTRKKNIKNVVIIPNKIDLLSIKNKYLVNLDLIMNDYNSNNISERIAYQRLSLLIRNFIYETTNIKVQNYTLSEIQQVNMPILYELVSEYYDPEFAKASKGNFVSSITKTRMVIERWR